MLLGYRAKLPSMLGIDLRLGEVSVLGMSIHDEQVQVTGWGRAPLAEDDFDGQLIKNIDGMANAIQDALLQTNLKYKYACIALSEEHIISKTFSFSKALGDRELESLALMKIAQYLPFPLSEAYMDFAIQGDTVNHFGMQDVLIIATHKDQVDSRVKVLAQVGLRVHAVDVDVFAVTRALNWMAAEPSPRLSIDDAKPSSAAITACGLALKSLW